MKRRDFAIMSCMSFLSLASDAYDKFSSLQKKGSFLVTVTVTFPYPMSPVEYKNLTKQWNDREKSNQILNEMLASGKIVKNTSEIFADKVITYFEFLDRRAWNEYQSKFNFNQVNKKDIKKSLGFNTRIETRYA